MNHEVISNELYKLATKLNLELYYVWTSSVVFTWRWWLGVALTILPWIVWLKIRNKKSTLRLLFVGLIVMLTTVSMDNIGSSYELWHYHWRVLHFSYICIPWD